LPGYGWHPATTKRNNLSKPDDPATWAIIFKGAKSYDFTQLYNDWRSQGRNDFLFSLDNWQFQNHN
jgi:hypothetical protein